MSHVATVWAYQQITGNPAAKAVLVALADKASDDGTCFPGQSRLSKMTELSEKTVRRHIAALELAGLLSRSRRHLKNGRRTSDGYVLALGQAFIVATDQELPDSVTTGQPARSERELPVRETTGHSDHRSERAETTGHSDPPSTSFNRQDEPSVSLASRQVRRSSSRFEEFWQLYPKRVNRKAAKAKWDSVTLSVTAAVVLDGLRRYVQHLESERTERRFIKGPEVWLSKGCWDDEYETAGRAESSGWQLPDPPPGMDIGSPEWRVWAQGQRDERRRAS